MGAASQGFAIHRIFSRNLPPRVRPEADVTEANRWLDENRSRAPEVIWRAVQATYRDVRADMMTKLHDHFPARERAWYDRVAVGAETDAAARNRLLAAKVGTRTPGQREADLRAIADHVATPGSGHNDVTLIPLGWKADQGGP